MQMKTVVLPRQARDKLWDRMDSFEKRQTSSIYAGLHGTLFGKKTALFEPFIYKNQHFTKTGSGQT
jgi:hypothetical protein